MKDMIERKGRVFRFGDHKDGKGRAFSLTSAEFAVANPPGSTVEIGFDPVNQGHYSKENAFGGKLGNASDLTVNGDYLDARFALHPLLDEAIREKALRMSAIFGVPSKKLLRIDVCHPSKAVIPEARFFASDGGEEEVAVFAEAMGDEDMADPGDDTPESGEEVAQQMHEMIAAHNPAFCAPEATAGFAGGPMSPGDHGHMLQLHDMCIGKGAKCPGMTHARFALESDPEGEPDVPEIEENPIDNAALFARLEALEAANTALLADNKRIKDEQIRKDSAQFASDNAALLPPASQALFAGLYAQLATDSDDSGVVEFAYGKDGASSFKGSPLDLLKKAVSQLKPHGMGVERMLGGSPNAPLAKPTPINGIVTFAADDTPEASPNAPTPANQTPSPERIEYLKSIYQSASNGTAKLGSL